MKQIQRPSLLQKIFGLFRWYFLCLLPFFLFSGLSAWHLYNLVKGSPHQGYSLFSPEQLLVAAPKLFWTGVIISGTLLIIVVINDLMDGIGKLVKNDQYP